MWGGGPFSGPQMDFTRPASCTGLNTYMCMTMQGMRIRGAHVRIKIGILRFKTVVSRACEVNTGTLSIMRSFLCVKCRKKLTRSKNTANWENERACAARFCRTFYTALFVPRIVNPHHVSADSDYYFHFAADPDPAHHQRDANLRSLVLQTLKSYILRLHASIVSVHSSPWHHFEHYSYWSGSSFSLWCGSGSGSPNDEDPCESGSRPATRVP